MQGEADDASGSPLLREIDEEQRSPRYVSLHVRAAVHRMRVGLGAHCCLWWRRRGVFIRGT